MTYIQLEDKAVDMFNAGLAKLRSSIQKYPLFSTVLSGAVTYYSAQYGPAIRAFIKLVGPSVGLKCE